MREALESYVPCSGGDRRISRRSGRTSRTTSRSSSSAPPGLRERAAARADEPGGRPHCVPPHPVFEGALSTDSLSSGGGGPVLALAVPGVAIRWSAPPGVATPALALPGRAPAGALLSITDTVSVLPAFRSTRVPHPPSPRSWKRESLQRRDGARARPLTTDPETGAHRPLRRRSVPAPSRHRRRRGDGAVSARSASGGLRRSPDHLTAILLWRARSRRRSRSASTCRRSSPSCLAPSWPRRASRVDARARPALQGFEAISGINVPFVLVGMQIEARACSSPRRARSWPRSARCTSVAPSPCNMPSRCQRHRPGSGAGALAARDGVRQRRARCRWRPCSRCRRTSRIVHVSSRSCSASPSSRCSRRRFRSAAFLASWKIGARKDDIVRSSARSSSRRAGAGGARWNADDGPSCRVLSNIAARRAAYQRTIIRARRWESARSRPTPPTT